MPSTVTWGTGSMLNLRLFIVTASFNFADASRSMRGIKSSNETKKGTAAATISSSANAIAVRFTHFMASSCGKSSSARGALAVKPELLVSHDTFERVKAGSALRISISAASRQGAIMSQHKEFMAGLGRTSVRKLVLWTTFIALFAVLPALAADAAKKDPDKDTYDQDSIIKDAADFFGSTTEGLAKVI